MTDSWSTPTADSTSSASGRRIAPDPHPISSSRSVDTNASLEATSPGIRRISVALEAVPAGADGGVAQRNRGGPEDLEVAAVVHARKLALKFGVRWPIDTSMPSRRLRIAVSDHHRASIPIARALHNAGHESSTKRPTSS